MATQKTVFLLEHVHTTEEGDDAKTLGIFSSRALAEQAIDRFKLLPGFKDAPDGFTADEYTLDEDSWVSGYVTLSLANPPHDKVADLPSWIVVPPKEGK